MRTLSATSQLHALNQHIQALSGGGSRCPSQQGGGHAILTLTLWAGWQPRPRTQGHELRNLQLLLQRADALTRVDKAHVVQNIRVPQHLCAAHALDQAGMLQALCAPRNSEQTGRTPRAATARCAAGLKHAGALQPPLAPRLRGTRADRAARRPVTPRLPTPASGLSHQTQPCPRQRDRV